MSEIIIGKTKAGKEYQVIRGTGHIFSWEDQILYLCSDDAEEAQWCEDSLQLTVEDQEVVFYIQDFMSFATVQEFSRIIEIMIMEHDENYMKEMELNNQRQVMGFPAQIRDINFKSEKIIINDCLINNVELASNLADNAARDEMIEKHIIAHEDDMWIKDDNGDTHYTEDAQEIFNRFYDYFYDQIEQVRQKV